MFTYTFTIIYTHPSFSTEVLILKHSKFRSFLKHNDSRDLLSQICFRVPTHNTQGKEGMWIIDAKHGKGSITFYGTGIKNIVFNMY